MKKPKWVERVNKAKEESKKTYKRFKTIEEILNDALKELEELTKETSRGSVVGSLVKIDDITEKPDYKKLSKDKGTNRIGDVLFIQFAREPGNPNKIHVAVVGAGCDVGASYKYTSGEILNAIGWEWYTERAYIIPLKNLGGGSRGGCGNEENYLRCRNGVEHYVGEYLINNNVPVLNYYQHWNVTEEAWKQMESRKFRTK